MAHRADGLNDIFEHDVTVRENIKTNSGQISTTPSADNDIVNKKYVDDNSGSSPSGSIIMFGGATAPTGWLLCDDSAISRTTYATLFAVIGETFGVGDGSTTFNVPDFRGIFPRGAGTHGTLTTSNATPFSGTLGTYANDKFQGHNHGVSDIPGNFITSDNGSDAGYRGAPSGTGKAANLITATTPGADGTNGSPLFGIETNPANLGITFIIKT